MFFTSRLGGLKRSLSTAFCRYLCYLALTFVCAGSAIHNASAALTISSTVLEDNGATSNGLDGNQSLYSSPVANPATATTAGGYDFTATMYMTLTSITSISVTLTIQDGNSGTVPGSNPPTNDFDYNHLHLDLDGTDTGLILNGFQGDGLEDTLTFSGAPVNAAAILASLKSDGKLVGTITTDNPNDTVAKPNEVFIGNDQANAVTNLQIVGTVPEPNVWAAIFLGSLGLIGVQRMRTNRRQS